MTLLLPFSLSQRNIEKERRRERRMSCRVRSGKQTKKNICFFKIHFIFRYILHFHHSQLYILGGITNNSNLGLVKKPSFRVDLKN